MNYVYKCIFIIAFTTKYYSFWPLLVCSGVFSACFRAVNAQVFIGPRSCDESTETYSVQVSVPVMDGEATIGVLIVGLKNIQ